MSYRDLCLLVPSFVGGRRPRWNCSHHRCRGIPRKGQCVLTNSQLKIYITILIP